MPFCASRLNRFLRLPRLSLLQVLVVASLVAIFLCPVLVEAQTTPTKPRLRGRNQWVFTLDTDAFYGFTERTDVHFDIEPAEVNVFGSSAKLGVEGNFPGRFSVRLRAGYQRLFYSSIGIDEIEKNYVVTDLLFNFFFPDFPVRNLWDTYFTVGPTVLVSRSGAQGFVTTGFGTRYFFNDDWSLRLEPLAITDFKGIRASVGVGVNHHF